MLEPIRKVEAKFFRNQFVPQTKEPLLWQGSLNNQKHWTQKGANEFDKTQCIWDIKKRVLRRNETQNQNQIEWHYVEIVFFQQELVTIMFSNGKFFQKKRKIDPIFFSLFFTNWWTTYSEGAISVFLAEMYKKLENPKTMQQNKTKQSKTKAKQKSYYWRFIGNLTTEDWETFKKWKKLIILKDIIRNVNHSTFFYSLSSLHWLRISNKTK